MKYLPHSFLAFIGGQFLLSRICLTISGSSGKEISRINAPIIVFPKQGVGGIST